MPHPNQSMVWGYGATVNHLPSMLETGKITTSRKHCFPLLSPLLDSNTALKESESTWTGSCCVDVNSPELHGILEQLLPSTQCNPDFSEALSLPP